MMSLSSFSKFCKKLADKKVHSVTVSDALKQTTTCPLILKHDIETNIDRALAVAEIEHDHGHRATFYSHAFFLDGKDAHVLTEIASMGHEIGYHYDVLDECDGDYQSAIKLFDASMRKFSHHGLKVSTICPHGNPLKQRNGWNSNKDFFKASDVVERYPDLYDVVNQTELLGTGTEYYSDAGYALRRIQDIRSNDRTTDSAIDDGEPVALEELLATIALRRKSIVVSIHPHRVTKSAIVLNLRKSMFYSARFSARGLMRFKIARRLLSPLFRLAKKF